MTSPMDMRTTASCPGPLDPYPVCLGDLEEAAAKVLPRDVWDFMAGGSGQELTLRRNHAALDDVHIVPRVLRDVSDSTTRASVLGGTAAMPVVIAPMAYHRLYHPEGELAVARAAKRAGVPLTVATLSSHSVEEIAQEVDRTWFQFYWLRDDYQVAELAVRAEEAGCEALLLTVDVPWMGRRLRDMRNQFVLPADVRSANLDGGRSTSAHVAVPGASAVAAHTSQAMTAALTWKHVEQLRSWTRLPLILKGILDPADARRAADCGADAIVVSNHGGRQLDGAAPAITMLPAVREAVGDDCEVIFDSGIRTGTDVLKALALGASSAMLGRPILWGLAAAGEAGVDAVLGVLAQEIGDALGLAGCSSVAEARQLKAFTSLPFRSDSTLNKGSPYA
ncbi:alpha-hydroxy acid oxidase [Streptomyces sp. NPDC005322]|uniref:alpha-hydroxy acid oxidase n=1 Tax=Streptomyces sp. NPDC005322 TaxID=3157032 RepID=UPI0033BCBB6A